MDTYPFFLGIRIVGTSKTYFFACADDNFALGDLVIASTSVGVQAGLVTVLPRPMEAYHSDLELKPLLRKADVRDKADYEQNVAAAKEALALAQREIEALGLDMNPIDAFYNYEGDKITICFTTSQKYVDFRELVRTLGPQLDAKLDLRQVPDVERARKVGGIGICGLPLCCSTFLNDGPRGKIQYAKNQMLPINNAKQSGPCGSWLCCLAYENDMYTEEKKDFPKIGTTVNLDEGPYSVHSYNIISRTVQLVNATRSDYKTYTLEDVKAMIAGTYVRPVEIEKKGSESELPSFGIEPTFKEREKTQQTDTKSPQKGDKQHRNGHHDRGRNRDRKNDGRREDRQQGQPRQDGKGRQQNQQGQQGQQGQQRRNDQQRRGKDQRQGNPQRQNNGNPQRQNNQQPKPQQEGGNPNNGHRRNHHHHGRRPNKNGGGESGGNA